MTDRPADRDHIEERIVNDAILTLDEIVEDRLEELLYGGHITQHQYQAAILGNTVPVTSLHGYLETCLSIPCEGR